MCLSTLLQIIVVLSNCLTGSHLFNSELIKMINIYRIHWLENTDSSFPNIDLCNLRADTKVETWQLKNGRLTTNTEIVGDKIWVNWIFNYSRTVRMVIVSWDGCCIRYCYCSVQTGFRLRSSTVHVRHFRYGAGGCVATDV